MKTNQPAFQETILDSINDGVFTIDKEWKITSFNKSAERITGTSKKEAIGKRCRDVFRADVCEKDCVLESTLQTGKPCINKTVHIINRKGKKIPISVSTAILKTSSGKIAGGVETFRDMSVIEELKREILGKHRFADIITKDHTMLKIFDVLPGMAKSDSTILITGDSGTGKELLAHAIHSLSNRADGPFISVNCGALPDNLLESELFGYKKGAFTDAKQDKPGRFHLAKGGAIFLDEIGDISKAMQVKLLRVLQEKRFDPLGSVKSEEADVRIITATNQELSKLVEEKKFRKDLYYRINVLTIKLPPLKQRKRDIPLLIEHFINHFNSIYQKEVIRLDDEAVSILMKHSFPGNIRELQNIIEHALIMCSSRTVTKEHLPEYLLGSNDSEDIETPIPENIRDFEKQRIVAALEQNRYSKQKTAGQLGMHPTTLWRKMKKFNLDLS